MALLFGILFGGVVIGAIFVLPAFHYWRRLAGNEFPEEEWRLLLRWLITGTFIPFALWFFFNSGLMVPPVWPTVAPLNAGVALWWKSFENLAGGAAFLISSYWAGITFAWLLARVFSLVESRRDFFILCGTWSFLLVPLSLVIVATGGWSALGMAMILCFLPLVHTGLDLKRETPYAPSYSRAIAKINFGKYDEAEREVIQELEHCEEDFNGWMMLAELYAAHFNDLPTAAQTVRDLCEQPSTTPVQISIALHRLADWHLKIGHDPVRAREVLKEIALRMPGTHLEKMAVQRLEQLPLTRAELIERERGKPMQLPRVPDETNTPASTIPRAEAAVAANECVEALKKNPDDIAAREKFARLLADNLSQANTGIEQLELLLAMPNQPARKRGEWLMTSAAWHARHLQDVERAKLIYEEVLRDFRDTPHAFVAQQRINLLNLQSQFRRRFAERAQSA